MHIFLHLNDIIIPWEPTNRVDFVAQSVLDSTLQYESLEGLMDFLAFLVQNLWQNKQKLIRGISTNSLGDYYKISGLLAILWHQKRQEIDLGLYRFISQPRIQPKLEPQFRFIVRAMTS